MLYKTLSAAVYGIDANIIQVEVDCSGIKCDQDHFHTVGLPDAAVRESRDRVRAALKNCGYDIPPTHITINLAPADIKMLVAGRDILPNYLRVCLTTTGKTLAERRTEAIGFVTAEMEALRFAMSHREDTIKLTQEVIQAKPDDPRPAYAYDETIKYGLIDAAIGLPMDKLNWMQSDLVKAGNLKEPIDLAKIIDADIRVEAAKRVGK